MCISVCVGSWASVCGGCGGGCTPLPSHTRQYCNLALLVSITLHKKMLRRTLQTKTQIFNLSDQAISIYWAFSVNEVFFLGRDSLCHRFTTLTKAVSTRNETSHHRRFRHSRFVHWLSTYFVLSTDCEGNQETTPFLDFSSVFNVLACSFLLTMPK